MTKQATKQRVHKFRQVLFISSLWCSLATAPVLAQTDTTATQTSVVVADTSKADPRDPYLRKGNLRRGLIMPTVLVGVGLALIDNPVYDRHDIRYDLRTKPLPNFKTNVDDYLFFAPAFGLAAFDIFSSQNRHNVTRQIGLLAASGALASGIMWPLKKITDVERPNGKPYAWPSGHTTYAFTIATMVSREFRGKSKWIGIGAYTIASATGVMRILNDAHWGSDVLAGAGVGILSTNLVYLAHDRWFTKKGLNTSMGPALLPNGSMGLGMVIHLK